MALVYQAGPRLASAADGAIAADLAGVQPAKMNQLADLEAELAARRTPELLADYGRALQAIGDPRGELIAIDLQLAAHGASAERTARRREQVDRWLGPELATRVLEIGAIDHGFVDLRWPITADELERLLASPALHAALRALALRTATPGCAARSTSCAPRRPRGSSGSRSRATPMRSTSRCARS